MQSAQEVYSTTVHQLPTSEQLQLASLILEKSRKRSVKLKQNPDGDPSERFWKIVRAGEFSKRRRRSMNIYVRSVNRGNAERTVVGSRLR